jgi:hypothetical protein
MCRSAAALDIIGSTRFPDSTLARSIRAGSALCMYIQIVKAVLDEVVEFYATDLDLSVGEILAQIRAHIDNTAKEHRQDEPEIEYGDPLCRLGYLYRHATANDRPVCIGSFIKGDPTLPACPKSKLTL